MADTPTAAEMLPLLTAWQDSQRNLHARMTELADLTGGCDGPLFDAVWDVANQYTLTLAIMLRDDSDWLTWYADENDYGRKGHEIQSIGGRKMRVRTVRQLAKLIEEGRHDRA